MTNSRYAAGGSVAAMAVVLSSAALAFGQDGQQAGGLPRVTMSTSLGDIVIELNTEKAPATALNFVRYVKDHFYDGTCFHRVIKGALIQGGAYTPAMEKRTEGLRPPVKFESSCDLANARGTIAAARVGYGADTATSQFFINLRDNPKFDLGSGDSPYVVFGRVVEGMDVVDKIGNVKVGTNPKFAAGKSEFVPKEPVVVKSVRLATPLDVEKLADAVEERDRLAAEAAEWARMGDGDRRKTFVAAKEEELDKKFTTTDSGLMYVKLREGYGASPMLGDTLEMELRGTLLDGTEFANTLKDTIPHVRDVDRLIAGLREGVQLMQEGGKALFVVPPNLAFGYDGVPGTIPSNASVVYEVELLSIQRRRSRK